LADISTSISCEIKYFLLGFSQIDIIEDFRDVLNGAVVHDNRILHLVVPETFTEKPGEDKMELSGEDTTRVNVAVGISMSARSNNNFRKVNTHLV